MQTSDPIFIDVREPDEFKYSHIEGAINIPLASISAENDTLKNLLPEANVILYCRSGVRASKALIKLQQLGFCNVVNGVNQEMIKQSYRKSIVN